MGRGDTNPENELLLFYRIDKKESYTYKIINKIKLFIIWLAVI